tara:strand:+ start:30 stop:206 length:177 start_codon:yes stop_codon:yes gene_type:complete
MARRRDQTRGVFCSVLFPLEAARVVERKKEERGEPVCLERRKRKKNNKKKKNRQPTLK